MDGIPQKEETGDTQPLEKVAVPFLSRLPSSGVGTVLSPFNATTFLLFFTAQDEKLRLGVGDASDEQTSLFAERLHEGTTSTGCLQVRLLVEWVNGHPLLGCASLEPRQSSKK